MRSTAQSSFAAMLLLIPILAVPMLAIFGVPDFAPVVESPLGTVDEDGRVAADDAPPFASAVQVPEPDFAAAAAAPAAVAAWPAPGSVPGDQSQLERLRAVRQAGLQGTETGAGPVITAAASAPSPFRAVEDVPAAAPFPPQADRAAVLREPPQQPPGFTLSPAVSNGTTLTWRAAVQRLNQLEIRNFRLEPGRAADQFIFICSYTPRDNPRVSYRFEAEADEPLKAVEKVLAQIDNWLASR